MTPRDRLVAALIAAAGAPGGADWVWPALASAPGCRYEDEVRGLLGKVRRPAGLVAGEWRFEPAGDALVRVVHEVGGIRLAQQQLSLEAAAGTVADAVVAAARSRGAAGERELAAVLEGIETAASP